MLRRVFASCPIMRSRTRSSVTISLIVLLLILQAGVSRGAPYTLDDSVGLGRRFDGIGGLSGGGVSDICLASCVHWLGEIKIS